MSVFGSLFTAVSGLSAQSDSISMISNNIANVATVGYKRTDAAFKSLVTTQSAATAYSPGSVSAVQNNRIDQQGILQQSSSATDIAISGNGFFVVKASPTDSLAEPLYTRAGSFSEDATGVLRNTGGFYLYGWPVDQNGNLPASQANISSLVPVNVAFLGGLTSPTTTASLGVNLNSSETQSNYPVTSSTGVDFTRAIQVFDSLGTGHDLTINFTHVKSPTATAVGNTDISAITGNIAGQVGSISSSDTFTIAINGGAPVEITLDGTTADLLAQINGITDPLTSLPLLNAQIDSNGNLSIKARNIGDSFELANLSGTPLDSGNLGLTAAFTAVATGDVDVSGYSQTDFTVDGFANTDAFDVTVGSNPAVTVTLDAGMTKLLEDLNAIPGLSAAIDDDGFLVLTSSQDISLADVSGTPLDGGLGMSVAVASSPIAVAGVINPPVTSPDLLTGLDDTKALNTDGWWEVSFVTPSGAIPNRGMINFTGSGQLNAVPNSDLKVPITLSDINWGNGSEIQDITFDMAGYTQFAGDYNVVSSVQNGASLGLRTGVSIDEDGYVIAQFSNGQSKPIYRLPIATFANINGLNPRTGNVFAESDASGSYNLREAGVGGAGAVAAGSLEASNVDLAEEFSQMIITQRAYSANTKVISAADQMTQDLLQIT